MHFFVCGVGGGATVARPGRSARPRGGAQVRPSLPNQARFTAPRRVSPSCFFCPFEVRHRYVPYFTSVCFYGK